MPNNVTVRNTANAKEITIEFDGSSTKFIRDNQTGAYQQIDSGPGPNSAVASCAELKLTKPGTGKGGRISGIYFPSPDRVIIFTNSPGCYWYWNGRRWIWR